MIFYCECLGCRYQYFPQSHGRRLYVRTEISVISILFKFHQFLPWMWCGYRDHLICLWISVLGGIESVFLWHAEGTACSWASSAHWLWHQNSEQWRRDEHWYRDVSPRNASTARRTISIFCKILPFFSAFELIFLRFLLALYSGHQFQNTSMNW